MANISVARRYAKALLEVASETNSLDVVTQQIASFASALENSPELRELATNPSYSTSQRSAVVEGILRSSGEVSPAVTNLLKLLLDRNRLASVPDISRIFRDMADVRMGRVRGKLTTAVAVSPEVVQRMERHLEQLTQRKVQLEASVDPRILGGASAQVGSVVYDGSIRSQLEDLRRSLKQTS